MSFLAHVAPDLAALKADSISHGDRCAHARRDDSEHNTSSHTSQALDAQERRTRERALPSHRFKATQCGASVSRRCNSRRHPPQAAAVLSFEHHRTHATTASAPRASSARATRGHIASNDTRSHHARSRTRVAASSSPEHVRAVHPIPSQRDGFTRAPRPLPPPLLGA